MLIFLAAFFLVHHQAEAPASGGIAYPGNKFGLNPSPGREKKSTKPDIDAHH
ncbi:hypothetical protein [Hymenobacter frigidus]|jgi:hypothetical protein